MLVNRVIRRNRRIPGRATGYTHFVIRWPGGKLNDHCPYSTNLVATFRIFKQKLRMVPPEELERTIAQVDAEIRKPGGGCKRVPIATWKGTQPLPEFFHAARLAWNRLSKEDDERKLVPDEIDLDNVGIGNIRPQTKRTVTSR